MTMVIRVSSLQKYGTYSKALRLKYNIFVFLHTAQSILYILQDKAISTICIKLSGLMYTSFQYAIIHTLLSSTERQTLTRFL